MRLYLKRTGIFLLTLMGLACILVFQSVNYQQSFDRSAREDQDEAKGSRRLKKALMNRVFGEVLSHEESVKEPVVNSFRDENSIINGDKVGGSKTRLKFQPPQYKRRNAKLLSLLNFLPNDSKLLDDYCNKPQTLDTFFNTKYGTKMPRLDEWDKFYAEISSCDLYRKDSELVKNLLQTVAVAPIKHIANLDSGTQVKFVVTFENDKKALFKPMRFSRSFETHPDQFYFTDFERHNAEIAAYHLDKLLGFRRAVPTVGRVVNMTSEFMPKADRSLAKTFFYSPAKNLCFVGKCDYYCDTTHAVCGKPDMIEGSFQVFLPDEEEVPRDHVRSPYKRTYSKRSQLALWQKDRNYCNWKVKYTPTYANGRALLDLIDLYILDFLIGNQDRHHYETFTVFDGPVYFLHLDNGRAFGKTKEDDLDILAPLSQCCVIRPSTLRTLLDFYAGAESLGEAMKISLNLDPVNPVLADGHFAAVDRRLETVLKVVYWCIHDKSAGDAGKILVNSFHNPDAPAVLDEDEEDDD